MNVAKSRIFGVGVPDSEVSSLASLLACRWDRFPFTYLGFPVGGTHAAKGIWKELTGKVARRLDNWTSKLISIGGRSTLIKAVLNSLPTYMFSLFKAPVSVLKNLDCIRRCFFWGHKAEEKKVHWVDWSFVTSPKEFGGLGFGSLYAKNVSLLCKWFWRFKKEDSALWKKCISAIYGESGGFVSTGTSRRLNTVWSRIIKTICDVEKLGVPILSSVIKKLGDGNRTKFWKDTWGDLEVPLSVSHPRLFAMELDKDCLVADRWKLSNGTWTGNWNWRSEVRGRNLDDMLTLVAKIDNIRLLSNNCDTWSWKHCYDGVFKVCLLQKMIEPKLLSHRYQMLPFPWNNWIPKKINIGVWRMFHNRLPTGDNLLRKGIVTQPLLCPLCDEKDESLHHLLFDCHKTSRVWRKIWDWWRVSVPTNLDINNLVLQDRKGPVSYTSKRALKSIEFVTAWAIWRWRNKVVFSCEDQNSEAKNEDIFPFIQNFSFLSIHHRSSKSLWNWTSWLDNPSLV